MVDQVYGLVDQTHGFGDQVNGLFDQEHELVDQEYGLFDQVYGLFDIESFCHCKTVKNCQVSVKTLISRNFLKWQKFL